ncbi:MAG TPA: hypothetical protein VGD40_22150, partial [Chryseosolibacter sp.]
MPSCNAEATRTGRACLPHQIQRWQAGLPAAPDSTLAGRLSTASLRFGHEAWLGQKTGQPFPSLTRMCSLALAHGSYTHREKYYEIRNHAGKKVHNSLLLARHIYTLILLTTAKIEAMGVFIYNCC